MWQRWNSGTKIFEKSSDNGGTWTPLGLDAAIITQGTFLDAQMPASLVRTNGYNKFTVAQQINPGATVASLDPGDLLVARNNLEGAVYFGADKGVYFYRGSANMVLGGAGLTVANGVTERGRAVPMGENSTYSVLWRAGAQGPTMNNGTLTGGYIQVGKTVFAEITLIIGTTTVLPADPSAWLFSLPVSPLASFVLGSVAALHGAWYSGIALPATATQVLAMTSTTAALGNISNTYPWAWAANDQLRIKFQYTI